MLRSLLSSECKLLDEISSCNSIFFCVLLRTYIGANHISCELCISTETSHAAHDCFQVSFLVEFLVTGR